MKQSFELGDWMPALKEAGLAYPVGSRVGARPTLRLLKAEHVLPLASGYGPVPSFADVSGVTALAERANAGYAGFDLGTNPFNAAGTQTKLYWLTAGGTVDVSRSPGYTTAAEGRWEFAQFQDALFAVNGVDKVQFRSLFAPTSVKFADVAPNPPRAAHAAIVGQQLVLGDVYDETAGAKPQRVHWSAIGNPFSWPTPSTPAAAAVLSDFQDLDGPYGAVQRIIGGTEVGLIFQERALWRMDFVGGDVIYDFTRVEEGRGLLAPQLAVALGNGGVWYVAEDGFFLFDGSRSQPMGEETVAPFFLADVNYTQLHRASACHDPDRPIVFILYASSLSSGNPDKLLAWNWALDRWASIPITTLDLVCPVASLIVTSIDAMPDDVPDAQSGSWEQVEPGLLQLGGYTNSSAGTPFRLQAMNGTPTATARLLSGMLELEAGRRGFVRAVRPLVQDKAGARPATVTCGLLTRAKFDEEDTTIAPVAANANGDCQFRADARYHAVDLRIAGDFDHAYGVEIDHAPSGDR